MSHAALTTSALGRPPFGSIQNSEFAAATCIDVIGYQLAPVKLHITAS